MKGCTKVTVLSSTGMRLCHGRETWADPHTCPQESENEFGGSRSGPGLATRTKLIACRCQARRTSSVSVCGQVVKGKRWQLLTRPTWFFSWSTHTNEEVRKLTVPDTVSLGDRVYADLSFEPHHQHDRVCLQWELASPALGW